MSREQLKELFLAALEEATVIAEKEHNLSLPRKFEIEFHGFGYSAEVIDVDTAIDALYLGEELFVRLVDIAAKGANSSVTRVFVRVSGYPHVSTIEETWGGTSGKGPFKQLISFQFQRLPD